MARGSEAALGYVIGVFPTPSETFVYREVVGLLERGLRVEVFSFVRPSAAEIDKLDPAAQALVERVHYITPADCARALPAACTARTVSGLRLNRRLSREATGSANPWARLARGLAVASSARRLGVDWLHAHWPYGTQVAAVASRLSGLPLSLSVHAHEVAHEAGHFPAVFDDVAFATFCNGAAMDFLLKQLPKTAGERCHLVYHGVNLAAFEPIEPAQPPPPLRIVTIGRLTRTKGFDRLIEVVRRGHDKGLDLALTIVGDGSEREALEAQRATLPDPSAVKLTGWVSGQGVREAIAESHLFAMLAATNYHDGIPNVVLEALASARPVALSPLPAAKEVIDGRSGFMLSSAEAIDELVSQLAEWIEQPNVLSEMGRRGREVMEAKFDADVHLEKLVQLFSTARARQSRGQSR